MIRILLVDDHPALRAGLTAVLRAEPGMVPLGTAASEEELWPALHRTKPDVVVLDYHVPPADGLQLCRRIKRTMPPPAVLLYSAYADASLVIPATLAGADGVVNKGAPASELYDAIRTVARGDRVIPPLSRELLDTANDKLDPQDLPILGMVLDGTPEHEIARTLGLSADDMTHRVDRMIGRLKVEVPAPRAG
jgi:DNA-binding NarL/FixJ family response regulator